MTDAPNPDIDDWPPRRLQRQRGKADPPWFNEFGAPGRAGLAMQDYLLFLLSVQPDLCVDDRKEDWRPTANLVWREWVNDAIQSAIDAGELAPDGKPPGQWPQTAFLTAWDSIIDKALAAKKRADEDARNKRRIELAAERDKAKQERKSQSNGRPGPKPTDHSDRVKLIASTLGMTERNASYIAKRGTTNLDYQRALAAAFFADPEWCVPGNWRPRQGRGRGRWHKTFRVMADYVECNGDRLDDDAALAMLRLAYDAARLQPHYKDSGQFVADAMRCGLSVDAAWTVWQGYVEWSKAE